MHGNHGPERFKSSRPAILRQKYFLEFLVPQLLLDQFSNKLFQKSSKYTNSIYIAEACVHDLLLLDNTYAQLCQAVNECWKQIVNYTDPTNFDFRPWKMCCILYFAIFQLPHIKFSRFTANMFQKENMISLSWSKKWFEKIITCFWRCLLYDL